MVWGRGQSVAGGLIEVVWVDSSPTIPEAAAGSRPSLKDTLFLRGEESDWGAQ